ncbi:hypothetical protein COOONC_19888 [Cooperia oncophora]
MFRAVVFCCLLVVILARTSSRNRLPCGFSCTRNAQFVVNIDGVSTTTTCTTNSADPRDRCYACCQARALAAGLSATDAGGFPSTNGVDCVCCTNNRCPPADKEKR